MPVLRVGLQEHGKQWRVIQQGIPTRTVAQIRTHAQKFFIKVNRVLPKGTSPITFLRSMTSHDLLKALHDAAPKPSEGSHQGPAADDDPEDDPEEEPDEDPDNDAGVSIPKKRCKAQDERVHEEAPPASGYALRSLRQRQSGKQPQEPEPDEGKMQPAAEKQEEDKQAPQQCRGTTPPASSQLPMIGDCLGRIGAELNAVLQHVHGALHPRTNTHVPPYWQTLQDHTFNLQRLSNDVYGLHHNVSYMNQLSMYPMHVMPPPNPGYIPNYPYPDMNQGMQYPDQNNY